MGHAFYNVIVFCDMEEGPGGRTAGQWLQEQSSQARNIPRTTMWWLKRLAQGLAPAPVRKPYTLRVCQKCGQPAQKQFGHSQLNRPRGKEFFCALYEGKSLQLWLAKRRKDSTVTVLFKISVMSILLRFIVFKSVFVH